MSRILVAGLDGSLRNFGVVTAWLDLDTMKLEINTMDLIKTEKSKEKQVRSSSDNLARAQILADGIEQSMTGVTTCFLEVPSGGQDYKSVLGFGIVIGLYACLPAPVCEVSPSETKKAAVGTRTASKEEMIDWATEKYPTAPWRRYERGGKGYQKGDITKDNEHLADAVAIIEAGINTPAFKQTLAILKANARQAA